MIRVKPVLSRPIDIHTVHVQEAKRQDQTKVYQVANTNIRRVLLSQSAEEEVLV